MHLSETQEVQKNKATVFQGKHINGERKFAWGIPKRGRYGENTKLIDAWKNLKPNDLLIIYDEKDTSNLYVSKIENVQESKELSKELWGTSKYELVFFFTTPKKVPIEHVPDEFVSYMKELYTLANIDESSEYFKIAFDILDKAIDEGRPQPVNEDTLGTINMVHFKQIILYGPPGTGKTFTAKQMARKIVADCSTILKLLDSLWSDFVKYLNGRRFRTYGRGSEFFLKIRDRATDKLAIYINDHDTNLSIYKDKVGKILQESSCNPREYTSTRDDTDYPYNRVVAEEFIKWLFNNHFGDQIKLVQFHPSYTYEDFVRGIQVETQNGSPIYRTVNRVFAEMCEKAIYNPDKNFVLIIDELNRANLPAVLGELIYALEYRDEPVETPYEVNGSRTLIVPNNLYIIGTMNTADRSVGHIDYAIRRRFYFLPVRANKEMIESPKAKELYENTIEKIFTAENMSPEFRNKVEDVKIGHTYFLGDNDEAIAHKFVYQVIPLLIEYIQDGILKDEAVVKDVISEYFGGVENWKELTTEVVISKLQS